MVCKFLDSMSAFFHGIPGAKESSSYLLEGMGLKNRGVAPVGLRIASATWQPILIRIRAGKD